MGRLTPVVDLGLSLGLLRKMGISGIDIKSLSTLSSGRSQSCGGLPHIGQTLFPRTVSPCVCALKARAGVWYSLGRRWRPFGNWGGAGREDEDR